MSRKAVWFLMITLIVMTFLTGCAAEKAATTGSPNEREQTKGKTVRIGYQKGNTLNILKVKGNLEERLKQQGIAVEWKVFSGGGLLLEALAAGSIDYGHAADGSGVFGQSGGKPFVYVGSDLPNPEGIGVMVHKDSGITSIKQLKGKKIAAAKGGNHHYLTILAIEKAGVKLDDVQFVYVKDASEGRALFETKQVDALASWDPFFAGVEADLQPITLTDGKGYTPNPTFYYANEQFAKENSELIKIILEETQKSDEWANQHKPEVITLLSETLGIDQKTMERAVNRRTYGVRKITPEIIAPQQHLADTYARVGLIPAPIKVAERMPLDAAWVPDFLK